MVSWLLIQVFTFFLDICTILGVMNSDKDLEIIVLRQQVRILQRKVKSLPVISDPERIILAILTDKLNRSTGDARRRLDQVMMVFKPDTVLGWHRELVRRQWYFKRKGKPGRPVISSELETLIVRLAKENMRWGYDRICGELLKLGYEISASAVRNILSNIGSQTQQTDHLVPGATFWGITKLKSWLVTSSQWRPFGSKPSTYCSLSNLVLDASIWQVGRRTPIQPGLPSKLVNWFGI